jgi:hypothetical protein
MEHPHRRWKLGQPLDKMGRGDAAMLVAAQEADKTSQMAVEAGMMS